MLVCRSVQNKRRDAEDAEKRGEEVTENLCGPLRSLRLCVEVKHGGYKENEPGSGGGTCRPLTTRKMPSFKTNAWKFMIKPRRKLDSRR